MADTFAQQADHHTSAPAAAPSPGDVEAARGYVPALCVSVLFVALADWLFWKQPVGWTAGAFGFLLAGAALVRGCRRIGGAALLVLAGLIGLLGQCVFEPTPLAVALSVLGLVTLALTTREGWAADAVEWFGRWGLMLTIGWLSMARDTASLIRVERMNGAASTRSGMRVLLGWLLPAAAAAVFFAIFTVANPVLTRWVTTAWESLRDFVQNIVDRLPEGERLLLWVIIAAAVWALLRYRSGIRARPLRAAGDASDVAASFPSATLLVRCLVLFNLVFALQSTLDVRYLWWGEALPRGLTYAEYAHRGAYPLVGAALLAAAFVLLAFRVPARTATHRWARVLVYLWLVQNLFLVLSAAWRLRLYVDAYSLTRFRVAAAIWMLLILAGLVWIMCRIAAHRSGTWLININTLTAIAVLYVCAFVDVDGYIARFNVAHCRELHGAGPPIDVKYLERLGPESLPALARLADSRIPPAVANEAAAAAARLRDALGDELSGWRGWTWRRQQLAGR